MGRLTNPRRRALVTLAVASLVGAAPVRAQDPRTSVVAAAARDWLALVDRGDVKVARARAAAKFRDALSEDAWFAGLASQRNPRGSIVQRSLQGTRFERAVPGAPDGEYAVLLYRSAFEKLAVGAETVTLERERDGVWRVVGYTIQ
jgi:hypothetical protein